MFLICFAFAFQGCLKPEGTGNNAWRLVYQNNMDGKQLYGDREELVSLMKKGVPIRVAWGGEEADGSSWIEFAEPDFVTIMNDSAVVVQFPMSLIQTHYTDASKSYIDVAHPSGWRALMSTTGTYHQFHHDFVTNKISRVMYCRTTISWFALSAADYSSANEPVLTPANSFSVDSVRYFDQAD